MMMILWTLDLGGVSALEESEDTHTHLHSHLLPTHAPDTHSLIHSTTRFAKLKLKNSNSLFFLTDTQKSIGGPWAGQKEKKGDGK